MDINVSVVQMDCVLADVDANLEKIANSVKFAEAQGANVVVFPELGTTGVFVGERINELAEPVPGRQTERLGEIARGSNVYLVAGMIERGKDNKLYNSLVLISPDGKVAADYHKVHMFSIEKELFTAGDRAVVVDTDFGRVGLTVCYDIVFPEYIRGIVLQGAKIILNGTDWITNQWQTEMGWGGEITSHMAATRALENGIHLAMANRVGTEEGWRSLGHSCICSPSGSFLAKIEEGEGIATATMELEHEKWNQWRNVATYLPDRRVELYRQLLE